MGRTSVIAITQFVLLALGSMALRVLRNANALEGESTPHSALALFLVDNIWWLVLIPAVWALYANIAGRVNRGPLSLPVAHGVGIVLIAAIVVIYALPIVFSGA